MSCVSSHCSRCADADGGLPVPVEFGLVFVKAFGNDGQDVVGFAH
jgi:hypothetical protein